MLPDDLLPGVGDEKLGLRETLRAGGWVTIAVVVLIVIVEQFSRQATGVLAPDIGQTFGFNNKTLFAIAAVGGVALVLGAVPVGRLADQMPRKRIAVASLLVGAVGLVFTALAGSPFQLFWAFALVGLGTSFVSPVFGSLLADQYPIAGRGKIFAFFAMATPIGLVLGPLLAGSVADLAGGPEGWRWSYIAIAVPVCVLAIIAGVFLKEPTRGQFEQEEVLGEVLQREQRGPELPITISTAFQRLKKIKTFYFICMGLGVLGFALITVPLQLGLLLRDTYGYGPFTRGWLLSVSQVPAVFAILVAGFVYDRTFRSDPERVVRIGGILIIAFGVLLVAGLCFQPIALLIGFYALASACTGAAFASIGPIVSAVAPYRIRAQAVAIVPLFTVLWGGFLGGILAGGISDDLGPRAALAIVVPISSLIGGWLFLYGARFLKRDISLAVEELLEEQAEQRRMSDEPDKIPVLQVRNLDFSYGTVQVLFDVGIEVRRGEVVALLGTNGAGKSTLLRAISGLGIPDRGVVRLNGRALTYVDTEVRFRVGVVQLRGGAGVFPGMSVAENLHAALVASRLPPVDANERIERVLALFPTLQACRGRDARDLSGGQQQMLALAMALLHEPEVLLIDELSLGLAPVVVQELLGVLEQLKAQGLTMIIVEQSLNLALEFADRAVFMEKGAVQFEGPTKDLLERDDLVRAVFLGGGVG